jgi:predicted transcriptional regulator
LKLKYRSRTEIIDSMLRSVGSGATKTHIMYRAYMSYSQLKEYLDLLEERGLLVFDSGTKLYSVTPKGLEFMNISERIEQLVPVGENNVVSISNPEKVKVAPKFEY